MTVTVPNWQEAVVDEAQAKADSRHFKMLGQQASPYGVIRGVNGECAVTWSANLDFNVAAGLVMNALGTAFTVGAGSISLDAAHATLPRYDLIVINNAGAIAKLTGTPTDPGTGPPPLPDYDHTDEVVLAMAYVPAAATALSADHLHDLRVECMTVPSLLTTAQRDAMGSAGRPKGWMFYDTTRNDLTINVGTGATPMYAHLGTRLNIAGQNDYTGELTSEFQLLNKYGSAGGTPPMDVAGTRQMYHTSAASGSSGHLFLTAREGYRHSLTFEDAQRRHSFAGPGGTYTWYPQGGSYYPHTDPDGIDEPMSLSSHGRLEPAHAGLAAGGAAHIGLYAMSDRWSDTTRTVVSLGGAVGGAIGAPARYTRERWRVSSVNSISYASVLLVAPSTFVPGRDTPVAGHEYVYVIPDYAGPWGAAGNKTNTDPVTGNPEMDVLRGFWGTFTFAHSSGDKLWFVSRDPNNQSVNIHTGPDSYGFYHRREATSTPPGSALWEFNNDVLHSGIVGFADPVDSVGMDNKRDWASGLERPSGIPGRNVLSTWGRGATHAANGAVRPATAFRIAGHSDASDHATTLAGAMFYRQDLHKFRFRENATWRSLVVAEDGLGRSVLLDNIGSATWPVNVGTKFHSGAVTRDLNTPMHMLKWDGSVTHSGSDAGGFNIFSLAGTYIGVDKLDTHSAWLAAYTFKTDPAATLPANSFLGAIGIVFSDQVTVTADTVTAIVSRWDSSRSAPAFRRTNSGVLTVSSYHGFVTEPLIEGTGVAMSEYYQFRAKGSGLFGSATVGAGGLLSQRWGAKIEDIVSSGTFERSHGVDIDLHDNASIINRAFANAGNTVFTPHPTVPDVNAASFAWSTPWARFFSTLHRFTSQGNYVMTSALPIPSTSEERTAMNGQILILENSDTTGESITLQDESLLSGSNFVGPAYERTIGSGDKMLAMFQTSVAGFSNKIVELGLFGRKYSNVPPRTYMPRPIGPLASLNPVNRFLDATSLLGGLVWIPAMSVSALEYRAAVAGSFNNVIRFGVFDNEGRLMFLADDSVGTATGLRKISVSWSRTTQLPAGCYYVTAYHSTLGGARTYIECWDTGTVWNDGGADGDLEGSWPVGFSIDPTAATVGEDSTPIIRLYGRKW